VLGPGRNSTPLLRYSITPFPSLALAGFLLALLPALVGCRREQTGRPGLSSAEQAALAAMTDGNPYVRGRGAAAAAETESLRLLPDLRAAAVSDPHWFVRYRALAALRRLRDRSSLGIFLERLDDPDPSVRFQALEGTADLGNYSQIPRVTQKLSDPDAYVRAAAAFALGRLRVAEAVPSLILALARDDREVVRREAYLALKKITGKDLSRRPEEWDRWWKERAERGGGE
jgi:HEAT repeat protein